MAPTRIYIVSSDQAWAYRLSDLVLEEKLGTATLFHLGKGALVAYREMLPDIVLFDLRHDHRDVAVALSMIREIFPRMAKGGVVVIGHADPADRESVRQEREQLNRIQLAEYLPRNTPEDFLLERLHALRQRAQEHEAPAASAPPARMAPASTPGPASADRVIGAPSADRVVGVPVAAAGRMPAPAAMKLDTMVAVPCQVKLMLSRPDQAESLCDELADLGAESLEVLDARSLAAPGAMPDFLIVDGGSAEQNASFLTQLRRHVPGLRILQLPDEGDKALRRLSKDISALISLPGGGGASVAQAIRRRVVAQPSESQVPILLLVEDEQNIRELTAHYLLLQGYEVYQAEDGQEAMTVFRSRTPDLILSDVYMPRMNGFKLLLEVKNWAPDLPMLMMTGYSSATQVLNTSKYRNVSFLPKPFRLSELGERIRTMLGTAS